MGWYNEKAVEIRKATDGSYLRPSTDSIGEWKVARAIEIPRGQDVYVFPLTALDPITKVWEEPMYQMVLRSIKGHGLFHPLVVHPISVEEWKKELLLDKHQTPPPMDEEQLRLRVQVGCNRYFALKELGFTAVECVVLDVLKEAQDLGHVLYVDKSWQRGDNLEVKKQAKEKRHGV